PGPPAQAVLVEIPTAITPAATSGATTRIPRISPLLDDVPKALIAERMARSCLMGSQSPLWLGLTHEITSNRWYRLQSALERVLARYEELGELAGGAPSDSQHHRTPITTNSPRPVGRRPPPPSVSTANSVGGVDLCNH